MNSDKPLSQASCLHILGLSSGATDREIQLAFRNEAKKVHPDVLSTRSKAEQEQGAVRFRQLSEAKKRLLENDFPAPKAATAASARTAAPRAPATPLTPEFIATAGEVNKIRNAARTTQIVSVVSIVSFAIMGISAVTPPLVVFAVLTAALAAYVKATGTLTDTPAMIDRSGRPLDPTAQRRTNSFIRNLSPIPNN